MHCLIQGALTPASLSDTINQNNGCGGQLVCRDCAPGEVCSDKVCTPKDPAAPPCVPDRAAACAGYICGEAGDGW